MTKSAACCCDLACTISVELSNNFFRCLLPRQVYDNMVIVRHGMKRPLRMWCRHCNSEVVTEVHKHKGKLIQRHAPYSIQPQDTTPLQPPSLSMRRAFKRCVHFETVQGWLCSACTAATTPPLHAHRMFKTSANQALITRHLVKHGPSTRSLISVCTFLPLLQVSYHGYALEPFAPWTCGCVPACPSACQAAVYASTSAHTATGHWPRATEECKKQCSSFY